VTTKVFPCSLSKDTHVMFLHDVGGQTEDVCRRIGIMPHPATSSNICDQIGALGSAIADYVHPGGRAPKMSITSSGLQNRSMADWLSNSTHVFGVWCNADCENEKPGLLRTPLVHPTVPSCCSLPVCQHKSCTKIWCSCFLESVTGGHCPTQCVILSVLWFLLISSLS